MSFQLQGATNLFLQCIVARPVHQLIFHVLIYWLCSAVILDLNNGQFTVIKNYDVIGGINIIIEQTFRRSKSNLRCDKNCVSEMLLLVCVIYNYQATLIALGIGILFCRGGSCACGWSMICFFKMISHLNCTSTKTKRFSHTCLKAGWGLCTFMLPQLDALTPDLNNLCKILGNFRGSHLLNCTQAVLKFKAINHHQCNNW